MSKLHRNFGFRGLDDHDDENPPRWLLAIIYFLVVGCTVLCWPAALTHAMRMSQDSGRLAQLRHTLRIGFIEEGIAWYVVLSIAMLNDWPHLMLGAVLAATHIGFGIMKLEEESLFAILFP